MYEWERQHLLMLANAEKSRHDEYVSASAEFKENSIKRILHYIEIRTEEEKRLVEYKTFIEAMEKSLELCRK